jgi:hypothetical protein
MRVKGEAPVTLIRGQTFYEVPKDSPRQTFACSYQKPLQLQRVTRVLFLYDVDEKERPPCGGLLKVVSRLRSSSRPHYAALDF